MKHTLPQLTYKFDALEPWIDERTMEIHYTKHHQAYVDKLNLAVAKYPALAELKPEDLMRNLASLDLDEKDRAAIRNAGGGHLNHTFFWSIMGPKKEIDAGLVQRINRTFGSAENFKKLFSDTAVNHFGSGWAWLVENGKGALEIYSTANQDSPLLKGHNPLIALDVWEHAYYLKYQNRRAEYVTNWWNGLKLI